MPAIITGNLIAARQAYKIHETVKNVLHQSERFG
jgi:hypothetical protein